MRPKHSAAKGWEAQQAFLQCYELQTCSLERQKSSCDT
jgi:hypothetical protein